MAARKADPEWQTVLTAEMDKLLAAKTKELLG